MKKTTYSCDWCGVEVKDKDKLYLQDVHNGDNFMGTEEICGACKSILRYGIFKIRAKTKKQPEFHYSPGAINYYTGKCPPTRQMRDCDICGCQHEIWEACPYVTEPEKTKTVTMLMGKPIDWWIKLRQIARDMMREAEQPSGRAGIEEMSRHLK